MAPTKLDDQQSEIFLKKFKKSRQLKQLQLLYTDEELPSAYEEIDG